MMNKFSKILYTALAGVMMAGCNDLDTEPMGGIITDDQRQDVIENMPEKLKDAVTAIFANFYATEGAYDDMLDFGYPTIMITLDSRSQDFITTEPGAYGWFEAPVKFQDNTATSPSSRIIWGIMYNTIFSANEVLGMIDADTDNETHKFYIGQAHAARAYAYWVLAQVYQFNYVGNEDAPCVPIITDKNAEEALINGAKRSSVGDVYTQMINDLNRAEELMDGNSHALRDDNRYIDLDVVKAIRARVYLCMQKYDKAADDAYDVLMSGSFYPLSVDEAGVPGFNVLDTHNWIWGIPVSEVDARGLYTFTGFMGSYSYGYAYAGMWQTINSGFFDEIPDEDVRKSWWISTDRYSNAYNYSAMYGPYTAAQYLDRMGAPDYAVTKFAPYKDVLEQTLGACDVPLIRIEEMQLILAESLAMGSSPGDGKDMLELFVNRYRWLDAENPYVCPATTPEGIRDEIWRQRRIELWGEGMAYFDCMRLNKGIDRSNAENCGDEFKFKIPAGEAVLLYQIPNAEIEGNPALTTADQNPTGSAQPFLVQ